MIDTSNKSQENGIDTDLYSRQIGTFGMEAMGKLVQMKVFIYGMRGLGVEVAKNITLAGPKTVTLYDEVLTTINDLGSNFYLTPSDCLKRRRDEASCTKIQELNPYVTVNTLPSWSNFKVTDYSIVVITEIMDREQLEKINEQCRANKVGFIYAAALGVGGFTFVDFGKEHVIRDDNGEPCKQYIVRNISKDKKGIVLIDDTIGSGKLSFSTGDYVSFQEVNGMTQLNNSEPREIEYVSPIAFSIGDTSGFSDYTNGGIVEQVKMPTTKAYSSMRDMFNNPYHNGEVPSPIDLAKFGINEIIHIAVIALHDFVAKNKELPQLNNEEQMNDVIERARVIYENGKKDQDSYIQNACEFKPEIVGNFARWARAQIVPVTSFLGGVVAQEIVKLTGKYSPIDQWLWFEFSEVVANVKSPNRAPLNTRYDDQISIFGREMQERISKMNLFMIGAGALGCEFLKEFALMGVSTNGGKTVVTDNDNIEVSNLNRQFLFRRDDVHHSKSNRASLAVKQINDQYNVKDLQSRVGSENEHIFNENFWTSQDFIINAVDNVQARKYIDNMCTWYGRPLIDSGTLGTKAHVQLVVPHVTSCYNDSQDPPEDAVPMCTIHNFPAMIEHCIEWGRDHFDGYFNSIIQDTNKLIKDPAAFYTNLKKEGNITFQLQKLTDIKKLIEISVSKSFDKCIELAISRFTDNFDHRIKQLLYNFPAEHTNSDGSKFWSGSKRVPTPLVYNPNDKLHLNFVACYSILIARCLSIPYNNDFNFIKEKSSTMPVPQFNPKKVVIKVNENDPDEPVEVNADEETQLSKLTQELSIYDNKKYNPDDFKGEDFEKDDDTNHHIDFIDAASNLRARNYTIHECDRHKTKMIAGKIIPAIATTTASITGLVALQIYTIMQTDKIEFMRGTYMNLAVSMFVLTEPAEVIKNNDKDFDPIMLGPVKAVPKGFTVWDKIIIDGSMTFQELMDKLKNDYDLEVNIITSGEATLIQTYLKSNKDRLKMKVEDVYNNISKTKIRDNDQYLVLVVSCNTADGTDAINPLVKYNFRK